MAQYKDGERYSFELMDGATKRGRRATSDNLEALKIYGRGYLAAAYDFAMWRCGARIKDMKSGRIVHTFEKNTAIH